MNPSNRIGRRTALKAGMTGLAALGLPPLSNRRAYAAPSGTTKRSLNVDRIERITVRVPYREIPRRAMDPSQEGLSRRASLHTSQHADPLEGEEEPAEEVVESHEDEDIREPKPPRPTGARKEGAEHQEPGHRA